MLHNNYSYIRVSRVDEKLTIKVADFGLTRDIYTTEYYRADKHATLPVKWMSLESLLDGYFDEKTDMVHTYSNKCIQYIVISFKLNNPKSQELIHACS